MDVTTKTMAVQRIKTDWLHITTMRLNVLKQGHQHHK